ncbi:MAG TPA: hypothetical protein VFI02_18065 [Armatimonadota bacterium]|nr:hypothetical protein [Armatimonadota bacterium]
MLVASAFSHVLNLPFFTSDDDDPHVANKVKWNGSVTGVQKAPGGEADAVATAYGFSITVEATRKTRANQWTDEFSQAIRHAKWFANSHGLRMNQVVSVLVCPSIYSDTYNAIRHRGDEAPIVIPMENQVLVDVLRTSILAQTMLHAEIRDLLDDVCEQFENLTVRRYCESVRAITKKWQAHVLKSEQMAFVGARAYRALTKMRNDTGRSSFSDGEILRCLERHTTVMQYYRILGADDVSVRDIDQALRDHKLAFSRGKTFDGEILFCPVCKDDFAGRLQRLMREVG